MALKSSCFHLISTGHGFSLNGNPLTASGWGVGRVRVLHKLQLTLKNVGIRNLPVKLKVTETVSKHAVETYQQALPEFSSLNVSLHVEQQELVLLNYS